MDKNIIIKPIGIVQATDNSFVIKLNNELIPALTNLDGFSHLYILWWGQLFDQSEYRQIVITDTPYKAGPNKIGIFATRSPIRPNPVLLTIIYVNKIDYEKGAIYTPYIDAEDGTPILDIKPYHANDRVKEINVPDWCSHWPKWYEDSATFNWQNEFNF